MTLNKRFETFQEHSLDYVRCLLPSSISASLALNPRTKMLLSLRYKKNAGEKDGNVTKHKQRCTGRNRVSCIRDQAIMSPGNNFLLCTLCIRHSAKRASQSNFRSR